MARAGRLRTLFTVAVALAPASVAAAEPSPPTPSALAPPSVTLKVTPGAGGAPWRLSIENTGEEPVRVPADARLLRLEITPPPADVAVTPPKKGAKPPAPLRCVLPDDARPRSDQGSDLVIPARRSWSATFDPLFYCFGARERKALLPGAEIIARFGWPAPAARPGAKAAALAPPFAVTPVGAGAERRAPAKGLEAAPFTLTDAVTEAGPAVSDAPASASLSVPEALDVARGKDAATTVTLSNESDRPLKLLFRSDMIELEVSGPAGPAVSCGARRVVDAPIRELFTTLAVKGRAQASVLLGALCPPGTFDEPGVYRVRPRLDTTGASGRTIGLDTWEGVATGKAPLLVRVRTPKSPALPPKPALD